MGNQQNFGAAQKDNRAKKQLALAITAALLATSGRFIATGGIQSLDGAAGGGINPWAIIAGYGTNDQIDPTASFTNVTLPDFSVNQLGVSIGIFNRLELSYAYQTGTLGITSIIDDFVGNVVADNRINTYFALANIPFLKTSLVKPSM